MKWRPILTYKRASHAEKVIHGAFSWVHEKEEIHSLGGDFVFYARSLLKPIQSKAIAKELALLLNDKEKALALASHNGEPCHLSILNKFDTSSIKLPSSFPLLAQSGASEKNTLFHPCSGKHAAILRVCKQLGWPKETYTKESHPFHKRLLKKLKEPLGEDFTPQITDKDSCGMPSIALSLKEMAQIYSYLFRYNNNDWIWEVMSKNSYLIGGKNRLDTEILKRLKGKILAKEGADGLLGLSIDHPAYPRGLGIVIKIAHGWDPVSMGIIAWNVIKSLFNLKEYPLFKSEYEVEVYKDICPL